MADTETFDWRRAQAHEMDFWADCLRREPRLQQSMNWEHQRRFIGQLAGWIGMRHPGKVVLDVGCGPCGLAPWLHDCRRIGIEPLADGLRKLGVDYAALGYEQVISGKAEQLDFLAGSMNVDIVLCLNVLDHADDPLLVVTQLSRLGKAGTRLFLVYDLRHEATGLHPRTTSRDDNMKILCDAGWSLDHELTEKASHDPDRISGRQFEAWTRTT